MMTFDSLLPIYSALADVVERRGRIYPAAVAPPGVAPRALVERSTEPAWIDPDLRAAGQAHLRAVARRSPQMHDGRVLAFTEARGLPIRCGLGGYFDVIATSDSLRAEFVDRSTSPPEQEEGLSALPLRRRAHETSGGDPLRSGRGRVAAAGVSVIVTIAKAGGRAFVIGRRNGEVATDPGVWQLAPSGTLEPSEGDPAVELVARELSEELGVDLPGTQDLATRLKPLGVGFDLLRLQPEICLRLDLEPHEYPPGGPFLTAGEFQERDLVAISARGMAAFWESHPPELLTPATSATLALLERAATTELN